MRGATTITTITLLTFLKKAHAKEPPVNHTTVSLAPHFHSLLTSRVSVTWLQVGKGFFHSSPVGRIPAASVSCADRLFVFGGETDANSGSVPNRYLNDLWQFTPESGKGGTWKRLFVEVDGFPKGPPARVSSSMVCMQSHLIIYGGIVRKASGENIHVSDLWSYDLQQSRWQQIMQNSSLVGGPDGLAAHTATVVDQMPDKMIVFGGSSNQGEALSDKTWIYSFIQQTWRKVDTPLCPGKRDFHTAVAIPASSKLKMWGGIDDKTVWSFDAKMEVWSRTSPGLDYESGRSGSYFHGTLFSFGGFAMESGNLVYSNSLQWQTADGKWMAATIAGSILPKGRCYAVFATVGEELYMFGGFRRTSNPADPQRLSDLWQVSVQQEIVMPAETARRSPLELPSRLPPKTNLQVEQKYHDGSDVSTYYV